MVLDNGADAVHVCGVLFAYHDDEAVESMLAVSDSKQ